MTGVLQEEGFDADYDIRHVVLIDSMISLLFDP
jgi:hypothetical protein